MVEKITINPEEIRAYGNISEDHYLNSFRIHESSLSKVKDTVNGALTNVYKLLYSLYGIMFDFDKGNKQLYLQMEEADTLSFGFEDKQFYLVNDTEETVEFDLDSENKELYITIGE